MAGKIRLSRNGFLCRSHSRFLFIPCHQFRFRGEFVHTELPLFAGEKVMLRKAIAIGAVRKRNIQHLSISHSLLQSIGNAVLVVLCFYHCNRIVVTEMQQIIRTFRSLTENKIALQVNLAVRYFRFHGYLLHIPFGGKGWRNILQLDVFFAHCMFR